MATSKKDLQKMINNVRSTQSTPTKPTDVMSMIDSVVKKKEHEKVASTIQKNMQADMARDKDAEVIQEYESIPSYNVVERALDKDKSQAYARKQELVDDYSAARERKAQELMADKGISQDTLEGAFIDRYATTNEGLHNLGENLSYLWNRATDREGINAAKDAIADAGLTDAETELLKYYRDRLAKREHMQDAVDYADEHEVLGTLNAGAGDKLAGSVLSTIGNAGAYLTGNPIDSESYWNHTGNKVDAMRQAASDELGTVGKGLYDVGTAVGDMVPQLTLALATGGATAPTIMAGASSFGDSTREAASRGLNPTQIMGTGVANAAIEMALEKIPVDNFLNIVSKGGKEASKSLVKEIAGQMGSEAFEEAGTETLTTIADRIINGDKSNFALNKQNYMAQGMTEADATKQAYIDSAKNVAYSGMIGGLAGGVTGGVAAVGSRAGKAKTATETLQELTPVNALQEKVNRTAREVDSVEDGNVVETEPAEVDEFVPTSYTHSNGIVPYDEHTSSNLTSEKGVTSNNVAFSDFVEDSLSATGEDTVNYYFGIVSDELADDIFEATGLDFEKYNIVASSDNIRHSKRIHSDAKKEAAKGQVPLDAELISRLPEVYNKPDKIYMSDHKDERGRDVIKFEKRINGIIIVADAITKGRKRLALDTMYIKNSHPTGADASESPQPLRPKQSVGKATFDSSISNSSQNVNVAGESTQKIAGFTELNQELDRLVGMYKGNENTQALYSQMKAAVNEYLQTGNQGAIDRAVTLAAQIDESLVGHSYTRKGSGKNSATAQNNRVTTTFTEGEFVDTLLAYQKELRDAAQTTTAEKQVASEQVTGGTQRVRGYNETLIQKTDAPQEVKNEFIENPDIYTQLSNETTLGRANEILANNDTAAAIAQYHSMLDAKDPAAVPLGYNLSKKLAQEGRLDESVQLVREMSRALTESGQFSQAAAITMLNNDPEAAKRYLIRELDTMNQKGKEQYGKKWKDFELTEAELKRFNDIKAGDTEGIKALYEDVYNRLRKEYPSTMTEKLLEYRRVAMLLNVRTNMRNVVSNALLFPVRWTADRVSALGEGAYSLINPDYKRTQSLNPFRSAESRKLASDAFERERNKLLGNNKYEDAKGVVRDKQVFKGSKVAKKLDIVTNGAVTKANLAMGKDINPSLMETAKNFTYWLLEKGDNFFVKKNFESRMASYIQAQGITDIENIPPDAYALATQEALKATFKDDSAFANGLSAFRQMLNKAPGHFIGEAVMPFTKTPANLAMRGIDYSPAGIYSAVKTFQSAKSNADVAKGLTQLGQAATGTAAIALGYVLAEMGFLKGALSDDKDEAQFQKQQGELAYSIKTPFGYLTYDWAQPASIPLILGVTIYDSLNNDRDLGAGLKQGALAAVDSWLELSPLQNLSDIFGGYGSPAENVWDVLSTDLPLSFLPAQMGAAAKIGDTTQRSTYDQTNYWNNLANQAKAKIPGWSETLPESYDTWGNPIQRQDNTWEAVLANLLNPGQFGNENVTPLDSEISRLYESTNDAGVFPKKAGWTTNDVKLDNEQYSEYQRIMGSNAYDMVGAFMDSAVYGSLADDQRVDAIAQMYSFADALAKSEVAGYDVANHNTYKKAYAIYQEKGAEGVAEFYAIKQNMGDSSSNSAKVNAVSKASISDEEKGYYLKQLLGDDISKVGDAIYSDRGGAALYTWYSFCIANDINGNSGKKKVSQALYSSGMSEADKLYFYNMFTGTSNGTSTNTSMTLERIAEIRNSIGK